MLFKNNWNDLRVKKFSRISHVCVSFVCTYTKDYIKKRDLCVRDRLCGDIHIYFVKRAYRTECVCVIFYETLSGNDYVV